MFCFAFKAVCVAVDTGLFASDVLSTLDSHTAVLSIVQRVLSPFIYCPEVPVAIRGSFVPRAVAVAVDTGLLISAVLSTLERPTSDFDSVTVPVRPFTLDTPDVHPPHPHNIGL